MNSTIYFNTNYVSSNTYIKVMWEIKNKGIFGVIYNPRTKKIQMQRYIVPYNFKSIVKGNSPNIITCSNDNFNYMKNYWNSLSQEGQMGITLCVKNLYLAYKKYLQLDTALQRSIESHEMKNDIISFQKDFLNTFNNLNLNNQTQKESFKTEWNTIDITDIDSADLSILAQKIADEKNPIDGVEFKGKFYRIFEDKEHHTLELQVLGGENNISIKSQTNAQIVRKFVQMVKMINASGLTDFITGNFYQVKDTLLFGGKKYYLIEDNNGIEHHIANDRFKELTVYTEPPKNSTETALS